MARQDLRIKCSARKGFINVEVSQELVHCNLRIIGLYPLVQFSVSFRLVYSIIKTCVPYPMTSVSFRLVYHFILLTSVLYPIDYCTTALACYSCVIRDKEDGQGWVYSVLYSVIINYIIHSNLLQHYQIWENLLLSYYSVEE